jgi:hypothetical protein
MILDTVSYQDIGHIIYLGFLQEEGWEVRMTYCAHAVFSTAFQNNIHSVYSMSSVHM